MGGGEEKSTPVKVNSAGPGAENNETQKRDPDAPEPSAPSAGVWAPWEDGSLLPDGSCSQEGPEEGPAPKYQESAIPAAVAARKVRAAQEELQELMKAATGAGEEEEDPLDAFMATEVLPEVKARQEEERRQKEEARRKLAEQLAAGKGPKLMEDSDEEEEKPDLEITVPTNRVKLLVGPGGTKIQEIQKRSKCRVQIKKEENELNRAFGSGPNIDLAKLKAAEKAGEAPTRMTTVMLFGDSKAIEIALRMIEEAVENKEQKQKQRHKEYEKKREDKRRNRMMYHLRHANDYEALELPMGASREDIKKAYRQLAKKWHPDKHPDDPEGAKTKFQEIQKAYDSLMSTDEDQRIEQLGAA